MVASIGAHEDERGRVSPGAGECAQVADGMAGSVEEVTGSVAEEIQGIETPNLQIPVVVVVEDNLADRPPLDIAVEQPSVGIPRPPWPRSSADAGSDNELRAGWECGHVPDVVEVVVRPYDGFDVRAADVQAAPVRVEDRGHVRSRRDHCCCFDERHDLRRIVLPVSADAEVEHNVVVAIGYQEAVYGCVKTIESLELGLPEELWVQVDKCITAT